MVGGKPVAILQFQTVDDVIARKLVHRRLPEMTGENQVTPLRTDRRQRPGLHPHERNPAAAIPSPVLTKPVTCEVIPGRMERTRSIISLRPPAK